MTSHNEMSATTFGLACGNALVIKGREQVKANQNAVAACALAETSMVFSKAQVMDKAGEIKDALEPYRLSDLLTPLKNEAGNNYAAGNDARVQHVIERLFGMVRGKVTDAVYNNARTQLFEAIKIAQAIAKGGYVFGKPDSDGEVVFGWNDKQSRLIVPYEFAVPAPKADADETKKLQYKKLKGSALILDGKEKRNYDKMRGVCIPSKAKGSDTNKQGLTATTLESAIVLVRSNMQALMSPDKKMAIEPIALNDGLRVQLHELVMACNAYFAADMPEVTPKAKNTKAA